jgi:transcriptional regulator with XRE-family HTH domain
MPTRIHPIDIHVGHRLRERRLRLKLELESLGSAVGVRAQRIQKYEDGRDRISSSPLYLLANALRVSVGYFFKELPGTRLPAREPIEAGPRRPKSVSITLERAAASDLSN